MSHKPIQNHRAGMLGYEVGDIFEWAVPDGARPLQVKAILYQPEAAGDFHL